MTEKRGRGRPRKTASEKALPVRLYLTPEERAAVDVARGAIPLSSWLRQAAALLAAQSKTR